MSSFVLTSTDDHDLVLSGTHGRGVSRGESNSVQESGSHDCEWRMSRTEGVAPQSLLDGPTMQDDQRQ
jgi:hypothetical protein